MIFVWFLIVFTFFSNLKCDDFWTMGISDERIRQERGIDAYQYLLFQKYLIYLLGIMTIISIFVILPVNIYSNSSEF